MDTPACCVPETRRPLKTRLLNAVLAFVAVAILGAFVWPKFSAIVPGATIAPSYAALFVLGIVASFSTCLGSTGAFLLAHGAKNTSYASLISIHVSRLLAFALGGALLGYFGQIISASSSVYGWLGLILGVGFLIVGASLLDLIPARFTSTFRLPFKTSNPTTPWLLGAATFILPCGFTQAAQALALATGSAWTGAGFMLIFALGTLPTLLGLSLFGSHLASKTRFLQLGTGAALILFAIGQLDGGLTVLGSPITITGSIERVLAQGLMIKPAQAEEQVIQMTVEYGAFMPRRFVLKRNVPVYWAVEGKDVSGCASTLISPRLGISRQLSPGTNVIRFTPKSAGEIPFSCGMGMIRGSFTVVE